MDMDDTLGKIVGFATWKLPFPGSGSDLSSREVGSGKETVLPNIPGVNMGLWKEMLEGFRGVRERDVERDKDMELSLFFVHPDYQHQGIGSLLLRWGIQKAEEMGAKIWLSSTAYAVVVYEKKGWKVVERREVELGKYGGEGVYSRPWMVRKPGESG